MSIESWFVWCLVVIVGLPIVTVALTEVHGLLVRRGNSLAKPVQLLRTYILPGVALLILLGLVSGKVTVSEGSNWVRIVATVLGFLLLLVVLSALHTVLFEHAEEGSWRKRLPSIFVSLGRLILVAVGVAVLFAWVWGADIGGLFAALGVSSIVLGLALQDAVGGIISGLLLLFEQPFAIGDWLEVDGTVGEVVEVNWRAVHLKTFSGTQVIPNSTLAGSSFTNHSRPDAGYLLCVNLVFSEQDPPEKVIATLNEVAADIDSGQFAGNPSTIPTSPPTYFTSTPLMAYYVMIPVRDYADHWAIQTALRTRIWYAARRTGLAFNGVSDNQHLQNDQIAEVLPRLANILRIDPDELRELSDRMELHRYAAGEIVERVGIVPSGIRYIVHGQATVTVNRDGDETSALTLDEGEYFGHGAVSRTPASFTITASTELTVLVVPYDLLGDLVRTHPRLARAIGQQTEHWNRQALEAATTS